MGECSRSSIGSALPQDSYESGSTAGWITMVGVHRDCVEYAIDIKLSNIALITTMCLCIIEDSFQVQMLGLLACIFSAGSTFGLRAQRTACSIWSISGIAIGALQCQMHAITQGIRLN